MDQANARALDRYPPPPRDRARLGPTARDHYPGLVRFVRRLGLSADVAEDVTQTAFLVTLEALPRILKGCERAFLYATAVRLAHGSRRKAHRELLCADPDLGPSFQLGPDELTHQKRFRENIETILDGIECRSRTVFLLFELDGLTIPEISLLLAISRRVATSRLRQARKHLRDAPSSRGYAPPG